MRRARLILDQPAAGTWNMAVDEALLRTAGPSASIALRVYRWEQPTLSLGYFQQYAQRQQHLASQDCPVVRRTTGGGAIIHDREFTYSLTAPVRDRFDPQVRHWYDLMHSAWVASLARHGAEARLCCSSDASREGRFLCFERRVAGDLLLHDTKVGGSAQRRHGTAALQHGSLLLERSAAAPELAGIAQLAGLDIITTSWLDDWISEVGRRLDVAWETGSLSDQEQEMAAKIADDKFGDPKWTLRR